jgi:tetratricopeptide (TPR) repeat protein
MICCAVLFRSAVCSENECAYCSMSFGSLNAPQVVKDISRLKSSTATMALGAALEDYAQLNPVTFGVNLSSDESMWQKLKYAEIGAYLGEAFARGGEVRLAQMLLSQATSTLEQMLETKESYLLSSCFENLILGSANLGQPHQIERVINFAAKYKAALLGNEAEFDSTFDPAKHSLFEDKDDEDEDDSQDAEQLFLGREGVALAVITFLRAGNYDLAVRLVDSAFDLFGDAGFLCQALKVVDAKADPKLTEFFLARTGRCLEELEKYALADRRMDDVEIIHPELTKARAIFLAKLGLREDAHETISSGSGYAGDNKHLLALRALVSVFLPNDVIDQTTREKEVRQCIARLSKDASDGSLLEKLGILDFIDEMTKAGGPALQYAAEAFRSLGQDERDLDSLMRLAVATSDCLDVSLRDEIIGLSIIELKRLIDGRTSSRDIEGTDFERLCRVPFNMQSFYLLSEAAQNLLGPMQDLLDGLPPGESVNRIQKACAHAALECNCVDLAVRARKSSGLGGSQDDLIDEEWEIQLADANARLGRKEDARIGLNRVLDATEQLRFFGSVEPLLESLSTSLSKQPGVYRASAGLRFDQALLSCSRIAFSIELNDIGLEARRRYLAVVGQDKSSGAFSARIDLVEALVDSYLDPKRSPEEKLILAGIDA